MTVNSIFEYQSVAGNGDRKSKIPRPDLPPPFFVESSASFRKFKAQEKMALALQGNLQFPEQICSVDFTYREAEALNAKVSFHPGNRPVLMKAMSMEMPGISFIQVDLENFKKLPLKTYTLELSHFRAAGLDDKLGIDIIINGQTIRKDYLPPVMRGREAQKEQFDITPFLKEGKNEIRIELSQRQQNGSQYFLRELSISTL